MTTTKTRPAIATALLAVISAATLAVAAPTVLTVYPDGTRAAAPASFPTEQQVALVVEPDHTARARAEAFGLAVD